MVAYGFFWRSSVTGRCRRWKRNSLGFAPATRKGKGKGKDGSAIRRSALVNAPSRTETHRPQLLAGRSPKDGGNTPFIDCALSIKLYMLHSTYCMHCCNHPATTVGLYPFILSLSFSFLFCVSLCLCQRQQSRGKFSHTSPIPRDTVTALPQT